LVHIRDVGLIPTDDTFCDIEVPKALSSAWYLTGENARAKIESPVSSREWGGAWYRRADPLQNPLIIRSFRDDFQRTGLGRGAAIPL
jgi:hypothetical protein